MRLDVPEAVSWIRATFGQWADEGSDSLHADREHEAQGSLGYGWVHYGHVRALRPDRVLAIGSRHGFIPSILAVAVQDNGIGSVDFVDANYSWSDGDAAFDGRGWWTDHSFGPLDPWVSMHLMRTDQFFPALPPEVRYGYIHVDGGHDEATARYDIEQSIARLAPGGLLAVHDSHAVEFPVRQMVNDLQASGCQVHEYPGRWGLSILQRS